MSDPGSATAAWSRYWKSGVLHSCPKLFPGNYGEEIGALWTGFFRGLPGGARVLDLGTGNGAIALIARDAAAQSGASIEIEAIDSAQIDPGRAAAAIGASLDGIRFRPGVSAESTGLPDASFDAVSGQYSLEFTDAPATIRELARIVKPGGKVLFVVHHAGSAVVAATREELEAFDFLEHRVPLAIHARRYLRRLAHANSMAELRKLARDAASVAQLREMNGMARQVVERARNRRVAFLAAIARRIVSLVNDAGGIGPTVALERLAGLAEEMAAHREWLRATLRAARTGEDMEWLSGVLAGCGFAVEPVTELTIRGTGTAGWVLGGERIAH